MVKLLRIALGIFLPPVGIFITYGVGGTLLLNILLTLLGIVPGSIHAVWAIVKYYGTPGKLKPEENS